MTMPALLMIAQHFDDAAFADGAVLVAREHAAQFAAQRRQPRDAVFDIGKPRANGDSNGVGVVINFTGGDTWVKSLRCLQRYGRMLTCGATAGYDPKTDIRFIWTYELSIVGSNGWERQDLIDLLRLTESRKITPVIDHVFPLAETRSAFAKLEKRDVCGKVIVKP